MKIIIANERARKNVNKNVGTLVKCKQKRVPGESEAIAVSRS